MRPQRAVQRRHLDGDPFLAEPPGQADRGPVPVLAKRDQADVGRGRREPLVGDQQRRAFHAHRETESGKGRAAQFLDQAVVAPAPQNRVLRSEALGGDLEYGAPVVVEPAHETHVLDVGHAEHVEVLFYRNEMFRARRAQRGLHQRRIGEQADALLDLAVEHAQRVLLGAAPAVLAHPGDSRPQPGGQRLAVGRAAGGIADGAQLQLDRFDPEPLQQPPDHVDRFRFDQRFLAAEHLDADLVELALASLLRPFVAKHRADVVQPLGVARRNLAMPGMLDERAHDGCGVLGPQADRFLALLERVHLLADDVRGGPDRTGEQLGRFEQRRADLPKAVAGEPFPRGGLEELPAPDLLGKDVVHAAKNLITALHGGRLNIPAYRGPAQRPSLKHGFGG